MANEEEGKTPTGSGPGDPGSELKRFLDAFATLPASIERGMLAQALDEDEKAFILAFSTPMKEQVSQITAYVSASSKGISRRAATDVADVLRIGAANTLVVQARVLSENLASESARIGLVAIVDLIKKIIRALIKMFRIPVPWWFDDLLELVNEIIRWIVSPGDLKLRSALSKVQQDYLADLTQLARLERESQWKYARVADED